MPKSGLLNMDCKSEKCLFSVGSCPAPKEKEWKCLRDRNRVREDGKKTRKKDMAEKRHIELAYHLVALGAAHCTR